MEEVNSVINTIMNSNVGIVISTFCGVFLVVAFAFGKTTLGKRVLRRLTGKFDDLNDYVKKATGQAQEFQEKTNQEVEKLSLDYEKKLSVALSRYEEMENFLYDLCDKIPNIKVKAIAEEFKAGQAERLATIREAIPTYQGYLELQETAKSLNEHLQNAVSEAEAKANALYEEKLAKVDEILKKLEEATQKANIEVLEGEESNGE